MDYCMINEYICFRTNFLICPIQFTLDKPIMGKTGEVFGVIVPEMKMVRARAALKSMKTLTCTLSSNVDDLKNKQYNVKGVDLVSSFDHSFDINGCFGKS